MAYQDNRESPEKGAHDLVRRLNAGGPSRGGGRRAGGGDGGYSRKDLERFDYDGEPDRDLDAKQSQVDMLIYRGYKKKDPAGASSRGGAQPQPQRKLERYDNSSFDGGASGAEGARRGTRATRELTSWKD